MVVVLAINVIQNCFENCQFLLFNIFLKEFMHFSLQIKFVIFYLLSI